MQTWRLATGALARDAFGNQDLAVNVANLEGPSSPPIFGIDAQIQRDKLSQLKGFMKTRELANSENGLRATRIN